MRTYLLVLFNLWVCSYTSHSQIIEKKHWGLKTGIVLNFGTHINQIGIKFNGYGTYGFAQVNLENTTTFSISNIGQRQNLWENRLAIGGILLGGIRNRDLDFVWGGLHHQSDYKNAVGYNFLWYRDNRQTSQNSGGWTLQTGAFQLFFENDLFAGTGRDKFRTGHLQLAYQEKNFSIYAGVLLWTGETRGSRWEKVNLEKCPNGFRILEDLPYGLTSHGVLYTGLNYNLPYGNFASARIGFDSEQVRHVFQNRMIHDLILLPKGIKRNTPHYPRLNSEGCAVFSKNQIRKTAFFSQLGLNNNWSY